MDPFPARRRGSPSGASATGCQGRFTSFRGYFDAAHASSPAVSAVAVSTAARHLSQEPDAATKEFQSVRYSSTSRRSTRFSSRVAALSGRRERDSETWPRSLARRTAISAHIGVIVETGSLHGWHTLTNPRRPRTPVLREFVGACDTCGRTPGSEYPNNREPATPEVPRRSPSAAWIEIYARPAARYGP